MSILEESIQMILIAAISFFFTFSIDTLLRPCYIFAGWMGPNGNCQTLSASLFTVWVLLLILLIAIKRLK